MSHRPIDARTPIPENTLFLSRPSRFVAAMAVVLALAGVSSCSRAQTDTSAAPAATDPGATAPEVRLGYFPNVTHAPALIGVDRGLFTAELGTTKLTTQTFNAGGDEVNALLGGSLDVAYIGSGPAINAFAKSDGQAVRLISGATSGGAQLVVRPDITSPAQLMGKTIATPQKGNTQDIALKKWLKAQNLPQGGGGVTVTALDNARTLDAFKGGSVDGGWLPEPWSSRLVLEAGAKVLVDEKTLWPGGAFPTTVIVARTAFLKQYPGTVEALLRGNLKAIAMITADPAGAEKTTNAALAMLTGKSLSDAVIDRAFSDITPEPDPLAATFPQLSQDSTTAGITETTTNLKGFLDVTLLDVELQAAGKPAVADDGLAATGSNS